MNNPLNQQWCGEFPCSFSPTVKPLYQEDSNLEQTKPEIVYVPQEGDFEPKPCPITGSLYLFPSEHVLELMDTPVKELVRMLLEQKGIYGLARNFLSDIGRLDAFRKYAKV